MFIQSLRRFNVKIYQNANLQLQKFTKTALDFSIRERKSFYSINVLNTININHKFEQSR